MWGVRLLTLALPWAVWPGIENPYLEPKAFLLTVLGWGLVCWRAFRLPVGPSVGWRNPWTVWVAGWVVGVSCWQFQWQFLLRSPGQSQVVYNHHVWIGCVAVLLTLLLARDLALGWVRDEFDLLRLTQWMVWAGTLAAAYACAQSLGFDQWFYPTAAGSIAENHIFAAFGNPGYLAIYLALLLPLCFLFSARRYLAYAALMALAIYLTGCRYAWAIAGLGLGASVIARWWTRLPRWGQWVVALGSLGLLLALGAYAWSYVQTDERWGLWTRIIPLLTSTVERKALCMTGYGLNSLRLLLGDAGDYAHNEWLQMAVEIGLIGTGLVLAMVLWSVRSGWQKATHSMVVSGWFGVWIGFLAASVIHFPAHLAPIAWVGLCAWAVMERDEGVSYG